MRKSGASEKEVKRLLTTTAVRGGLATGLPGQEFVIALGSLTPRTAYPRVGYVDKIR